ncbi:restriction endonuclease [Bacteroides gallinaceum]|uniref:restriction endonuclease n=1 Tax=Bacteroides gallinaceum TaxID=1462571 RepID=UPI00195DEC9B|nr:restriction endonuclease [Bacteroides gallinaceum]MBM6657506.1 restriction endonuclease [Bacteroides gallinaceum]MDN0064926.1 restriction endonuclease [Bacteroides gallinaceum]
MRILIEEYQYNAADVKDILHGIDALENVEGKVSIHYVGYYYNVLLKDCVFILPKVLLKGDDGKELVFGKYRPEEVANLDENNPLNSIERDFLYKFAVWIYRAIVVYKNDKRNDTEIVYYSQIAQVGNGRRRLSNTYLDILLSLIQFNKDNQNFFFTIVKNMHSGLNKINWMRTIGTTNAIIQDGQPIYLNPINKKRQINFDEELLIIFFSILNYIGDAYGFPKQISCQYQLITGQRFETYLNGFGKTRLRQIKYKYFSDKALQLWQLCFAFFDEARQVYITTEKREYLLVKSFYVVFEAIIDELVGDNPLPDGMEKKQEDGKIVDHLFTAQSLIDSEAKQTYYIGDSKYYKMGHELGSESVYKQYTYARNVIQCNLDIFNDGEQTSSGVKLRDDVTEGYNIIPNFFISAKLNENLDYSDDGIKETDRENKRHKKFQFKNRLFDRDTLLLFHYDVNFLFVLSLYARDNAAQKAEWKEKVRNKFRKEIQEWLQKDYDFYAMRARPGVNGEEFIKHNFKEVVGKIYTPFKDEKTYSLALDNKDPEGNNEAIKTMLSEFFYVEPCRLGQNPEDVLPATAAVTAVSPTDNDLALCVTKEGVHFDNAVAKMKQTGKLGIALNMNGATLQLVEGFTAAKYLIIHNKSNKYAAFFVDGKGPRLISANEMTDMVTTKKGASIYLVYNAELNVIPALGELDFSPITKSGDSYSPHLLPIKILIKEKDIEAHKK